MKPLVIVLLSAASILLSSCGQYGALYLPDNEKSKQTIPVQPLQSQVTPSKQAGQPISSTVTPAPLVQSPLTPTIPTAPTT